MLDFNLSQNMMAGTKLFQPNGRLQFCPMEDTFVYFIAALCLATDFFIQHTTTADTIHRCASAVALHFTFEHHGFFQFSRQILC